MTLRQTFRDELTYLRLQGREFARRNPQLAKFLGEQASDPDVERLLEGFAFLTAKLRLKIEDDFDELTHSLLQLLWPNYLRPTPSMTILRFDPVDRAITERQVLPKGMTVLSRPVDGVACQFRTCADLPIHPLCIDSVVDEHTRDRSVVRVGLRTLSDQDLDRIDCDQLDLHLSGDDTTALTLYLWTARYLDELRIVVGDEVRRLPAKNIEFPGFSEEDALLPYPRNVFDGYRILQEYFAFPKRFHYLRIRGLRSIWPAAAAQTASLEFHYSRPMPADVRLRASDIALHCVPAVNLFTHDAEPIILDGCSSDYPLVPSHGPPHAYEIFSIDRVGGSQAEGDQRGPSREYTNFDSFQHEIERAHGRKALYFRARVDRSPVDDGLRHRIAFMRGDEDAYIGRRETISAELTCTNRQLPLALGAGDVCVRTQEIPAYATFTSLIAPTPPLRPVLDGSLHWTLISNLSLNYLSLLGADPLKAVLRAYDFAALHDVQHERHSRRRIAALGDAKSEPVNRLIKGRPVRGLRTLLELDPEGFLCEGDLYLFGTVLSHFFSLYASINSFHLLEVKNLGNNETYAWPLQRGGQPVI